MNCFRQRKCLPLVMDVLFALFVLNLLWLVASGPFTAKKNNSDNYGHFLVKARKKAPH